jgi:hypothetical protein
MFVQQWGVLQSAIPLGISIRKTIVMVLALALAKLHNFCIDQTDTNILPMTATDKLRLMGRMTGLVPLDEGKSFDDGTADGMNQRIPRQLIGGGEHFQDVPREVRESRRRIHSDVRLPRERLAKDYVRENNYRRPRPRGTTE